MTTQEKIEQKRKQLEEQEKELNIVSEVIEKINQVKAWYGDYDETLKDFVPYETNIKECETIDNIISLIEKAYKL